MWFGAPVEPASVAGRVRDIAQEADFAFRQAFALCPASPEALFRYVSLLVSSNRADDARLLAETNLKFDPANAQVKSLLERLKNLKPKK